MKTEYFIEEIERTRRLSEFEATPRAAHDYCSAMPDKEMSNRYIEYLISQSESKDLKNRSLQLKIDELTEKFVESSSKINELLEELRLLRKELSESQKESRSYRKKIAKLEEQLKQAKAEKYGRRRSRSKDGDNNLAERSVGPFTIKRKCSLHFGSDEGVEMSAVYHSIISTLKLCGKSIWKFFGDYFRCEVLGLETYKDYLPALSR